MNRPPNEPYNVHSYNQLTSHNSQLLPCEIAITISLADWRLLPWREIARMRNTHRESTSCTACVAAAACFAFIKKNAVASNARNGYTMQFDFQN